MRGVHNTCGTRPIGRIDRVSTYTSQVLRRALVIHTMVDAVQRGVKYEQLENESESDDFKPLTRDEAQALRTKNPSVSPWRVVAVQAVAGLACCVAVWGMAHSGGAVWSALFGAAAVVVPNALLARGIARGIGSPAAMALGFMFWELVKIGLAVAMLVIAAKVVPDLSWPALLVTMVVCMKVNWVALLWRGR